MRCLQLNNRGHRTIFFSVIFTFLVMSWPASLLSQSPTRGGPAAEPPLPQMKSPRLVVEKAERRLKVLDGKKLIRTFKIALGFQPKGAKQKQGDGKTPEGEYVLVAKNPHSQFYLSLALNYPNAEDGKRAYRAERISKQELEAIQAAAKNKSIPPWNTALGGEIFIHGHGSSRDWTLGCIALDNPHIKALYDSLPLGTPVSIRP